MLSAFCLGGCSDNGKKTALEFNIASFNVGFCRAPNDVPVWNKRKDLIMPLAEYHDFDIVGMQEPFGFQVDYLLSKSPLYAAAGNIVRDLSLADVSKESAAKNVDRMLRNMNNPIFYKTEKFDLLSAGKFYFSDTPDKDVRGFGGGFDSIRSCVWTKFRDKKKRQNILRVQYPSLRRKIPRIPQARGGTASCQNMGYRGEIYILHNGRLQRNETRLCRWLPQSKRTRQRRARKFGRKALRHNKIDIPRLQKRFRGRIADRFHLRFKRCRSSKIRHARRP